MPADRPQADNNTSENSRNLQNGLEDIDGLIFFNVESELARQVTNDLAGLHPIEFIDDSGIFFRLMSFRSEAIDLVLLGTEISDPIGTTQRIHQMDKRLPIIILSTVEQSAQLRKNLMFSPFLGYEVLVWPTDAIDDLADVIADAAQRRQQRRRFQAAAIANAHVQLEVLPLLQPKAAEYVEGLLDQQPVGLLASETDGHILTLNRQARKILGLPEDDASGKILFDVFPKPERSRLQRLFLAAADTNTRLPPELFAFPANDDTTSTYIEVIIAAFSDQPGRSGVMLILQDVTLRIKSEKQRAEAVVELRLMANVLRSFHAISTDNKDHAHDKIQKFLSLGCEQFGMPIGILSHIEGQKFKVLHSISNMPAYAPGNELDLAQTFCSQTIHATEPVAFENAKLTSWKNHVVYKELPIEAYLGVRIVVDGAPFGTLCFMSKVPRSRLFTGAERETLKLISQRIASELQRERAEGHMRKLSSAMEQTADSVIITDRNGIVEYVNSSFETLTGYTHPEVVGQPAHFLTADKKTQEELWTSIGHGKNYRYRFTSKTKLDEIYHAQLTISPLKDNDGETTHLIATGQDITALVEAEKRESERRSELTHVARLSTLGGMVSGLAHELNQPLCAITTYAQTCLRKIPEGNTEYDDIRHGVSQIVRQAERADQIFTRMRNFSRKREMRRQKVNIHDIIEDALGFVEMEIYRNHVEIALNFDECEKHVFADPVQIQQVLLNLLRNSIDALSENDETERKITINVEPEGGSWTKVSVRDTGRGCPQQELHRLFEPFFTTKVAGLGVGLNISQVIIEAHGGKLWLETTSTEGSNFCLTVQNFRAD